MVAAVSTSELVGRVARVNERGILLRDHDNWANLSKWSTNITMPEVGQFVRLQLDRSGFVRTVSIEGAEVEPDNAPAAPTSPSAPAAPADRLSARVAALNASVRLVLRRPGSADTGEVLAVAEQITSWLLR